MTRWVGSRQVIQAAQQQLPGLFAEQTRLRRAQAQHRQDMAKLQQDVAGAWDYLATVLVPGLVAEHLNWASGLLALPPIAAPAVQAEIERDRAELESERARIGHDPEYLGAEAILNEASIRITELEESIAPLAQSVLTFEAVPFWEMLVAVGYGTDAYTGKWYTMSYYDHWKYGDRAVESLGPSLAIDNFSDLRARYVQESNALAQLRATLGEWTIKRDRVVSFQRMHANLGERLTNLQARHLGLVRGRVHQHLSALSLSQLLSMVSSFEPAVIAVKRIQGMQAKAHYLQQTHAQWVEGPLAGVEKAVAKNQRDVVKLARPKHYHRRFAQTDFDKRFRDRTMSWKKRSDKYNTARGRIIDFDEYDRYDFDDDVIWWSLMTNDTVKARFIPEVGAYYEHRADARSNSHDAAVSAMAQDQGSGADDGWDDMS